MSKVNADYDASSVLRLRVSVAVEKSDWELLPFPVIDIGPFRSPPLLRRDVIFERMFIDSVCERCQNRGCRRVTAAGCWSMVGWWDTMHELYLREGYTQ